jgi:hypothetical protein
MATFKPTTGTNPTPQGKKFENNFKKTMTQYDVNLSEVDSKLDEAEQSLKKKIFSLAKMEALVFSDPKLSAVYEEMSENGEEKYGYHYNETIQNMLFNDYVLNSPKYLQKYKQAQPKEKKRRDKSGINQLKKKGEEMQTRNLATQPQPKPVTEADEQITKVLFLVNEKDPENPDLFAYFPEENHDREGIYKTAYSHVGQHSSAHPDYAKESREATPEEYQDLKAELEGLGYNLEVLNGMKEEGAGGGAGGAGGGAMGGAVGATNSSSSGQYSGPAAWKKGGDLMENGEDYDTMNRPDTLDAEADCVISSNGWKYSLSCGGAFEGDFNEVEDALARVREWKKENHYYPNTWFISDHGNESLIDDEGNIINETTGSASSGAYYGPAMWGSGDLMKTKGSAKVKTVPMVKGGTIIGENYLVDPKAFERLVDVLNEADISYQTELGKAYQQSHTGSNQGMGVSEVPQTPEREQLKQGIDNNTSLYIGQDIDKMRDDDVKILHNDMTQKNSYFPHPNNPNLQDDGISGNNKAKEDNTIIDKTNAFSSDTVKHWNPSDTNLEMNTLKTGDPDKPDLNLMEDSGTKLETTQQLKDYIALKKATTGKGLTRDDVPKVAGQALFDLAIQMANRFMPVHWDDLADTNSMWSYIRKEGGMTFEQLDAAVKKACKKRMKDDGTGFDKLFETNVNEFLGGDAVIGSDVKDIQPRAGEKPFVLNGSKWEFETATYDNGKKDIVVYSYKDDIYYDYLKWREAMGIDKNTQTMNEVKKIDEKAKSVEQQRLFGMAHAVQKGELPASKVGGAVKKIAKDVSPKDVEDFASTKHKGLPEKVSESAQDSIIADKPDSMSNKATPTSQQSSGIDQGTKSAGGGGMSENKLNELFDDRKEFIVTYKNKAGKTEKANTSGLSKESAIKDLIKSLNIKQSDIISVERDKGMTESYENLLEEINKELDAFSIHHDKLKRMAEDRKPSALVLRDRVGSENEKNFKSDLKNSSVAKEVDIENALEWKDQQTDVGKDPQKLGADIEKQAIKAGDMKSGEALKDVGNSANDKGDEIPKRNMSEEEQDEVNKYRLGLGDLVYDNEVGKRFEDRMKKDMGEKLYKLRQEKLKLRGKAPMYNKDTQPIETGEKDSVQFNKAESGWNDREGIKESIVSGKYFDDLGKKKIIDFNLNEVLELKSNKRVPELKEVSLEGLGNTYTQKVSVNEGFVKAIGGFKFYTNGQDVFALKNPVQNLSESVEKDKKPVVNEQMDKMKHLVGYNTRDFVKQSKII